ASLKQNEATPTKRKRRNNLAQKQNCFLAHQRAAHNRSSPDDHPRPSGKKIRVLRLIARLYESTFVCGFKICAASSKALWSPKRTSMSPAAKAKSAPRLWYDLPALTTAITVAPQRDLRSTSSRLLPTTGEAPTMEKMSLVVPTRN